MTSGTNSIPKQERSLEATRNFDEVVSSSPRGDLINAKFNVIVGCVRGKKKYCSLTPWRMLLVV